MNIYTAQVIREEEGKRLEVYEDHLGYLTVGVGHRVVPADELEPGDAISEERCFDLFLTDLCRADADADRIVATLGSQMPKIKHVLVCMVFQLGYAGVLRFKRMLGAMRERDWAAVRREMLDSKWAREDTPGRAERLAASLDKPHLEVVG